MSFHFNCCSSSLLDLVKIKIFLYISLCKNSELLTSTWLWLDRTIQQSRTKNETKMLLTSNFYSVLYYNCEIWLSQGLNVRNKQQILAASSNALRILHNVSDIRISYLQLHNQEKRALPMHFGKYRLAIQLFKIYNDNNENEDWQDMNIQQNFNARNDNFHINDFSKLKVGKNILCNRLTCLDKH